MADLYLGGEVVVTQTMLGTVLAMPTSDTAQHVVFGMERRVWSGSTHQDQVCWSSLLLMPINELDNHKSAVRRVGNTT